MNDAPQIERHGPLLVVRDDLFPGGTKARILPEMLRGGTEYVYASPACGYAQVALAYSCRAVGAQASVFTAKRNEMHPRTLEAKQAGAKVVMVPYGYLSNVQAKAKAYAAATGASYLPFGFDSAEFGERLTALARSLPVEPAEVWSVAGSGTLTRALQRAWPQARFYAVKIGSEPQLGQAVKLQAPEPFEREAKLKPPFPSCGNYDAKAWRFIKERATPDALFWNVAA